MVSVRPPATCIELIGSHGAFTFTQIEEIEPDETHGRRSYELMPRNRREPVGERVVSRSRGPREHGEDSMKRIH